MSKRDRLAANVAGMVNVPQSTDYLDRALEAPASDAVQRVDPGALTPSPFQPVGRPSRGAVAAVMAAAHAAGSLALLVRPETDTEADAAPFRALDDEAKELAQLAADVATRGVTEPVEIRETDVGRELIAGHRRRAATLLVRDLEPANPHGHVIPYRSHGRLDNAKAAELVFRANRLRANFGAWQEAVSLATIRTELERVHGERPKLVDLAATMGYSLGRASELLAFAETLAPLVPDLGAGNRQAGGEALARLTYKQLRGLLRFRKQPDSLAAAARRVTGLSTPDSLSEAPARPQKAGPKVIQTDDARGLVLTVLSPIEELRRDDLARLLDYLTNATKRARTRLKEISTNATRHSPASHRVQSDRRQKGRAASNRGRTHGR